MNREEIQRIFRDPPVLQTKRLTLRRMLKSDYKDMYEYACQPLVTQYLLWEPHDCEAYTYKYLQYIQSRYRQGEFFDWAVVVKEEMLERPNATSPKRSLLPPATASRKMIGTCGFTRFQHEHRCGEVGYVLNPAYWGMELAPEAVSAVLRFGFCDLRLNRIEAKYMADNHASRRVMEKVGMTFEGIQRESMFVKGKYVSVGVCSILKKEYFREN